MRHFDRRRIALALLFCAVLGLFAGYPSLALPQQAQTLTLKNAEAMALRNHPMVQAASLADLSQLGAC